MFAGKPHDLGPLMGSTIDVSAGCLAFSPESWDSIADFGGVPPSWGRFWESTDFKEEPCVGLMTEITGRLLFGICGGPLGASSRVCGAASSWLCSPVVALPVLGVALDWSVVVLGAVGCWGGQL